MGSRPFPLHSGKRLTPSYSGVHLATHDALLLLQHSFALSKLLHCFRTAPCFLSPGLQEYDHHLEAIVNEITNIHFPNESLSWSQATLPVRSSGLGIRRAMQVAPSAYLGSPGASTDLVHCIVPTHLRDVSLPNCDEAEAQWSKGRSHLTLEGEAWSRQKS